jgi:hypothetical protein
MLTSCVHSNIGHDANALWKHYDDSVDEKFLINRQQMHVSILSIGSFVGRLLSGKGPQVFFNSGKMYMVHQSCVETLSQTLLPS